MTIHHAALPVAAPKSLDPSGQPLVAAAAGLFALVVSLLGSWHVSLWTDEAATISAAARSVSELWAMSHNIDVVHSTYYLFMHFWTEVFGISPFALRLPSALVIAVATVGVHRLGLRLSGPAAAAAGALVFAVLPRTTWLGIEARPFAFTAAVAVWATVVLLSALRTPSLVRWGGYALLMALGAALNIFVALLLLAHAVSLLLDRRSSRAQRRSFVLAGAASVVLVSPIVLAATRQTGQLGDSSMSVSELARNALVNQWFLGATPTSSTGVSAGTVSLSNPSTWWQPAAIGLAALAYALIAALILLTLRAPGGAPIRGLVSRTAQWCIPWLAVPTVVIALYSLAVKPMYSPRYLSFATPAAAILIGVALVSLRRRWLRLTAAALIAALVLPVYLSQRELYAKSSSDWSSVAAYIAANKSNGQAVYFTPRYPVTSRLVGPTSRGISTAYPSDFAGLRDLTLQTTAIEAANLTGYSTLLADSPENLSDFEVIWMIVRHDYPEASSELDNQTLAAAGFAATQRWSGPLDVVIKYSR